MHKAAVVKTSGTWIFDAAAVDTVTTTGSGSVGSVPGGIACLDDCTEDYAEGSP